VDVRSLRRAVRRRLAALRAWVTWSPRRTGTVVGVCLTVLVVSPLVAGVTRNVTGSARAQAAPQVPVASPTPTASAAPSPAVLPAAGAPLITATPSGPNDAGDDVSTADQAAACNAALRFASLWLAGAFVPDRERWADSLTPLVDSSLRPFLVATPASAIPRTSAKSAEARLVAPTYGAVRVTFADGTGMDLQMSATGSTWRVVQYLPMSTS
jgi:hypothetical protein